MNLLKLLIKLTFEGKNKVKDILKNTEYKYFIINHLLLKKKTLTSLQT